jgi:hypothetical protein
MNIEGLGTFYLGRAYDLGSRKQLDQPLLYDAKDLVTHAVCVGMTGSGKTGLCIGLLEEAALDGIPALVIDPKGDLSNLLLTFPGLKAEDFAPWINLDDAARKGASAEEYAAQQAELWRSGLEKWGQSGERIQRLRAAAEFTVYTPGSSAGVPVSVLKSFDPPQGPGADDPELFRERVQVTATSLLGLLSMDADPVQSREHILLSNLLTAAWQKGQSLDLARLIQQIQSPPFEKVGALELEAFYPSKERFELAMQLNNLLASPGFASWIEGVPMDIASFLHTPQGKPRVAIFSIAHLPDAERMFFVSLLLNQTVAWMRQQPGTTSLRALLYMDEIFGYFPPVANPPSKLPLLTLLKQARAYGLGVVLATQNPVDLDYKGLSNTGTWLIGRLQTERDKERVLEGLEGAVATGGGKFNRAQMSEVLAGLGNRVFLLHNVHDDAPVTMETRWTMSYLRGPLTRDQIKKLMDPVRSSVSGDVPGAASAGPRASSPAAVSATSDKTVVGSARVRYTDAKYKIDHETEVSFIAPLNGRTNAPDWEESSPSDGSAQGDPPAPNLLKTWQRDFATWLANSQTLEIYQCSRLKLCSEPGESERDFRAKIAQLLREERDQEVAALRSKYAPKSAVLQDRLRRAQAAEEKQKEQSSQAKINTVLEIGTSLLGAFLGGGRKTALTKTTMTKIATAGRAATRAYGESQDVDRAQETAAAITQQLADLQSELEAEVATLQSSCDPAQAKLETVTLRPKKTGVVVKSLLVTGE